jgi:hypothetical protein
MNWVRTLPRPATRTARLRLAVLGVAVVATALKLLIAAKTYGTNDVHSWLSFADGVRKWGPVDLYGHPFFTQYNHPPLSGRMLVVINWMVDHGISNFVFLIKVPASVADLVTALLVFELVRRRRPDTEAAVAAILVVCSPALFVISGFHANTDPVFVMFTLLSVYLVVEKRWAAAAGASFAVAISIKLVPIVLGPVLLVALVRLGWRRVATFAAGAAVVFVPLWGPVLLRRWPEFKENVLGYDGVWAREWGPLQFAKWAHAPQSWLDLFVGPGKFVVLLLSAGIPAFIAWRRPAALVPAVGLAMVLFLLISPAFSMQYLVWPLAAAYLINTWAATVYNLAASALILAVYSNWNQAPPWRWYEAFAVLFRPVDFVLMVIAWVALAAVAVVGLVQVWRRGPDIPAATDAESATTRADAQRLAGSTTSV